MNPQANLPLCASITRVLPARKIERVEMPGVFVRVKEASFAVNLGVNSQPVFEFDLGMQFRCPLGRTFDFLTLENPTDEENTVTLLIGTGEIEDDRLNVIERRNGSAPSTVPPTFTDLGPVAGVSGGYVKLADANPNRAALIVNRAVNFILTPSAISEAGMPALISGGSHWYAILNTKAEVWAKDLDASTDDFQVAELSF